MLASLQMVAQRCELSTGHGGSHFYIANTVNLCILNTWTKNTRVKIQIITVRTINT